jgi:formylglycine-generating enzyme required for sulfatase activity
MAGHVFVSYSRKDQAYARKLANELRWRDFEVWMDDRIDYGDRWWRTIVQAIRTCAAFVVVMTPDSERSEWVEREVMLALDEEKPIFPLLLRGEKNPLIGNRHYADVTDGQMPPQDFYDRLGQVLRTVGVPMPETSGVSPRPPARHPFEPEMILIPAGEFLMGSDPSVDKDVREDEQPQHTLHLPDYYLAKTPVTQAQYAAFVQATVHRVPYVDANWAKPYNWSESTPPRGKEDHPVVLVSWHDAVTYCRWLAEVTGKPYRLPSEAEWEKGARGTDGRIYPWGSQWDVKWCNAFGSGKGGTTSVEAYPQGASPYDLLDMAGNVWEWTRSIHNKGYPYVPGDGRENLRSRGARVLRGGSWDDDDRAARCANRGWGGTDAREADLGFRVVVSARSP